MKLSLIVVALVGLATAMPHGAHEHTGNGVEKREAEYNMLNKRDPNKENQKKREGIIVKGAGGSAGVYKRDPNKQNQKKREGIIVKGAGGSAGVY